MTDTVIIVSMIIDNHIVMIRIEEITENPTARIPGKDEVHLEYLVAIIKNSMLGITNRCLILKSAIEKSQSNTRKLAKPKKGG